jgi:hypothetical protein
MNSPAYWQAEIERLYQERQLLKKRKQYSKEKTKEITTKINNLAILLAYSWSKNFKGKPKWEKVTQKVTYSPFPPQYFEAVIETPYVKVQLISDVASQGSWDFTLHRGEIRIKHHKNKTLLVKNIDFDFFTPPYTTSKEYRQELETRLVKAQKSINRKAQKLLSNPLTI